MTSRAQSSLRVNVPRLITADYTERPGPSVAQQRVLFGDLLGWSDPVRSSAAGESRCRRGQVRGSIRMIDRITAKLGRSLYLSVRV